MLLSPQFFGKGAGALANPSQGGFRVPAHLLVDQSFQRLHQPGVGLRDGFAARSLPTDASHQGGRPGVRGSLCESTCGRAHRPARPATHTPDTASLARHDPARALIQMRPRRPELLPQQLPGRTQPQGIPQQTKICNLYLLPDPYDRGRQARTDACTPSGEPAESGAMDCRHRSRAVRPGRQCLRESASPP